MRLDIINLVINLDDNHQKTDFLLFYETINSTGVLLFLRCSVLDVQISMEESMERVLRARGKPSGKKSAF